MKRRLSNLVAILSLHLCAAVAVLGVLGFFASPWWPAWIQGNGVQLHAWRGRVFLAGHHTRPERPDRYITFLLVEDAAAAAAGAATWHHPNAAWDGPAYPEVPPGQSLSAGSVRLPTEPTWGWGSVRPSWHLHRHPAGFTGFVSVPCWLLLLVLGSPLWWRLYRQHRRRRQATSGRCSSCGYDLRATPDRCPECGKIPAAAL